MKYLLLSVLVIFAIGLFVVEDTFGESIIKEKDCVEIGKELDSNIKCRIVLTENIGSPFYHDQERDILYFGNSHDYTGRDWDSFNILIPRVSCDPVTTGTYVETTTYPCELQIEEKPKPRYLATTYGRIGSFIQEEKDVIFAEVQRYYDNDFGSWAKSWMALYNHDGQFIRWLDDYHSHGTGMDSHACDYPNPRLPDCANLKHKFVQQSKTEVPYIYYVVTSGERYRDTAGSKGLGIGLHVIKGTGTFPDIHSYKTDIGGSGKIYLNEDKNELYYFSKFRESEDGSIQAYRGDTLIYQINGMGELKSAAAASEPEPTQSSDGCGEGTELVNGVCQLTKTSGTSQEDGFGVSNLVSVIVIIIAIVGTIALVKSRKKKSSITQPAPEKTEPKPRRKPAESRPTSSSCSNCGKKLKPTAKFCGGCGSKQ